MPIKDFEGRGRIPRLGKVRLGEKVERGKTEYPRPTDYFVCPIEVRAVYGEKPKTLQIAFHSDNIDELKDMWIKVGKLGYTKEDFKKELIKKYKIKESSKELTRKQFDEVMTKLKKEQDEKDKEAEEIEKGYEEAERKGEI